MSRQTLSYAPAATQPSLGQRTSRGFVWLLGQTVAMKIITAFGQVVIAWLLMPEDMGLVSLAYTISGFIGVVQQTGIRDILISRHQNFRRWASAAFWIALFSGFAALATQTAIGPLVPYIYPKLTAVEASRVAGLLIVLGISAPFMGLLTVPQAKLNNDLRFRLAAMLNAYQTCGILVLSIIFAAPPFRLGAYAIILPRPIIFATQAAWMWWYIRPSVSLKFHFRRWKFLLSDSGWSVLTFFFGYVVQQGDYLTLGVMHPSDVVGVYYFAFNLSMQAIQVFTVNLWGVLLPALAKLQDDIDRQTAAFLRAAKLLAIVVVPICLLQAAGADPAMHIFFKPKWYSATPILQVLSIAMAIPGVTATVNSLMLAQGRFRTNMICQAIGGAFFVGLAITGSHFAAGLGVATAVMIYHFCYGPIYLYTAIRRGKGTFRDVASVFIAPLFAGAIANGAAMLVARQIPPMPLQHWASLGATVFVSIVIYVPLISVIAPDACLDLKQRILDMTGALQRKLAPIG